MLCDQAYVGVKIRGMKLHERLQRAIDRSPDPPPSLLYGILTALVIMWAVASSLDL